MCCRSLIWQGLNQADSNVESLERPNKSPTFHAPHYEGPGNIELFEPVGSVDRFEFFEGALGSWGARSTTGLSLAA